MTRKIFIILCVLYNLYHSSTMGDNDLCSKLIFKLSLFNQRNTNGKWETHVQLDGGNDTEDSGNKNFHVDVKQTVATCNCSSDVLSVEANIIAPPSRPGKNYTFYPNFGYYYLETKTQTSDEANILCNSDDAHLAVINSKEEANIISAMIQEIIGNDTSIQKQFFIGLYKSSGQEISSIFGNQYVLPKGITEENVVGSEGQPNNILCGTFNNKRKLKFVSCHMKLPSVCEQKL